MPGRRVHGFMEVHEGHMRGNRHERRKRASRRGGKRASMPGSQIVSVFEGSTSCRQRRGGTAHRKLR